MSSAKCTFNPEKARIAAENVRSYMKLRGQDFDEMIEESDKILKGLSDAELKAVVKEFDAFAHMIKRFPKGQLKEVAAKVDLKSNANVKYRVPGRTVQIYKGRPSFVRGGSGEQETVNPMDAEADRVLNLPEDTDDNKKIKLNEAHDIIYEGSKKSDIEALINRLEQELASTGGSSQRSRSRSVNSANSANSASTQPQHRSRSRSSSRSHRSHRSRSRSRSRHLGPQGRGIIPGTIRVAAALLIPRSKTRLFQTIMWLGIITMAGYSYQDDVGFIKLGLKQINDGHCDGGWGSFDWNRHPLCNAWKALKSPIVTGINDMYKLDPQGFFKLVAGLAGLVMPPIVLNSGFYWLAYFMDYQITLMVAAYLNIEFVAPEAVEPGLFKMLALYRQVTNPMEAFIWGRRLMGNSRRSRSRHRDRNRLRSHSHRSSSGHRNRNRGHRSRSSTRNLVELARIRALQNMVRDERGRAAERSPSPASLAPNRRRHTLNRNARRANNNWSNRGSRSSRRNSRRNAQNNRNNRSNRSSRRSSRR